MMMMKIEQRKIERLNLFFFEKEKNNNIKKIKIINKRWWERRN